MELGPVGLGQRWALGCSQLLWEKPGRGKEARLLCGEKSLGLVVTLVGDLDPFCLTAGAGRCWRGEYRYSWGLPRDFGDRVRGCGSRLLGGVRLETPGLDSWSGHSSSHFLLSSFFSPLSIFSHRPHHTPEMPTLTRVPLAPRPVSSQHHQYHQYSPSCQHMPHGQRWASAASPKAARLCCGGVPMALPHAALGAPVWSSAEHGWAALEHAKVGLPRPI